MAKNRVKGLIKHPLAIAAAGTIVGLTTWTIAAWIFNNAANNTFATAASQMRAQSFAVRQPARAPMYMGTQPQTSIFPS